MIKSGEQAPSFVLPAVRDGEIVHLDLDSHLGEEVLILAFYPGDFNPACSGSETGLDELDLFTMQKDVTVLAISGDSVHSHQAFADQYNLHMPLLSDTDGAVADAYGVAVEEKLAGYLTRRAVVVVDHTGAVQYTWKGTRPDHVPTADEIRGAVEGIGDVETAESRYRVGHAHYMEGRRGFTSAMNAYEGDEWMMAQTDFTQAAKEFDEASEEFNTAARFAEREEPRMYFERAEQKSESLWRAADWLAESASAFASGQGAKAESLRGDAEAPLETARDLHEPPLPDEFPPEEDPAEQEDPDPVHPLADNDEAAPTLDADIDEEMRGPTPVSPEQSTESAEGTEPAADGSSSTETAERADTEEDTTAAADDSDSDEETTEIGDEELEEITAELEEQTEAAERTDPEPEDAVPDEVAIESEEEPAAEHEEEVELELTDPTDDEDDQSLEEDEEPLEDDSGDHGVPDSL